ncbi:MAG: DUF4249 family protein [candidate division WOR-3 bacterium]|nr:DUF4249 family protein [candidate division WOR-3 bacterium]
MRAGAIALAVVILLVAACERNESELYEPVLVAHCLILTGTGVPSADINQTYAIGDSASLDFPGANVTLKRGQRTWTLRHAGNDRYVAEDTLTVVYGDTFYLEVTKPGFDTVTGTTVVPDTFSILSPRDGDTVSASDRLRWNPSRGCHGYYGSIRRATPRGDTFDMSIFVPADSTDEGLPLTFLASLPSGEIALRLLALDRNYSQWMEAGQGQMGGSLGGLGGNSGDGSTLSGGIGVLGSASACSVRVYLTNQ